MQHLLVVGVRWPPETFIQRKLEGLAASGMKVTVASSIPRRLGGTKLVGVNLVRLPHPGDSSLLNISRFCWDSLCLRIAAPRRWQQLNAALAAPPSAAHQTNGARGSQERLQAIRHKLGLLRQFLPLARLQPDIVHFEWNTAAIQCFPLYAVWRAPVAVSCRGGQINVRPHVPGNEEFTHSLQTLFSRVSKVHCVSAAIAHEAEHYGMSPQQATIIRPAVDPAFFRPEQHPREAGDDTIRLITTGSLIWRKGYEYALLALRRLIDQGVEARLDIIGTGVERQRIEYTIDDLRLGDRVALIGGLQPSEVRDRLQHADIFILASLSEGISNAVLEAMASGLPVVTTDCGGMREAVSDGIEGFVVPARSDEAMASAILQLGQDVLLRQRMGRAARARIEREFSLDKQTAQWRNFYGSLLADDLKE